MTEVSAPAVFAGGQHIALRSVDRAAGVVMSAFPQIVVRDEPELIATYMPVGVVGKRRSGDRNGGPRSRQLVRWDGGHEDWKWLRTSVLMLHRPGDAFSLWSAWEPEGWRLAWWYVNIEEPWRRTAIGFDTRDLEIDLWSEPDLGSWHWKDEDELAWSVTQGRFTQEEATRIRADAERALRRVAAREAPFDPAWIRWRPDPMWTRPTLPANWKQFTP